MSAKSGTRWIRVYALYGAARVYSVPHQNRAPPRFSPPPLPRARNIEPDSVPRIHKESSWESDSKLLSPVIVLWAVQRYLRAGYGLSSCSGLAAIEVISFFISPFPVNTLLVGSPVGIKSLNSKSGVLGSGHHCRLQGLGDSYCGCK